MNKEIEKYINNEVENFRKELTSKVDALLEKENKPKTVWDLKHGDKYYTIYPRDIEDFTFHGRDFDVEVRENGNMFLTREEAQFELERRKIEAIMKKYSAPFENEKSNYYIAINIHLNKIVIFSHRWHKMGVYYFVSKYMARKVIEEVGEDNLIKYWF